MTEVQPSRRRFTVADFHTMLEAGVFTEDDRLELVDGEVVEMSPIGRGHAACVRNLLNLFAGNLPKSVLLDAQNPLRLSDEREFYPDVLLLNRSQNIKAGNIPESGDVLLAVEVSDSTLLSDRTVKLPRYAEAGVAEVWIVDLNAERVLVHRDPLDGVYGRVEEVKKGSRLSVAALGGLELDLADIL